MTRSLAEVGIRRGEHFGHEEQCRPDVEAVTVAHELAAAPARHRRFFQHSDRVTSLGQSGGGGNPTDARADDECRGLLRHMSSPEQDE